MGWKKISTDYFTFTRKDRIAVLVLVVLIVIVVFAPAIVSRPNSGSSATPDTAWMTSVKRLELKEEDTDRFTDRTSKDNSSNYQYDRSDKEYFNRSKGELFYFDPNTLNAEGWKKLGLRDKTVKTIQNYLAKGGHFYKPEDLSKIYGLFEDEYIRLEPYIRIEGKKIANPSAIANETALPPAGKTERYKVIDINTADTSAFISLPGIGSKLAARIVNFRDKLGGFYAISQVAETYGLPDSTFQKLKQYLKLDNASLRKININTASVDELKAHPYIKYALANTIVAYRKEHGSFLKLEDIKKVMVVTEDVYHRIYPYLIIE
ncbi:MAG: helix-hairpin-helix domain-containing protein [Chitinophagaceae bacterium]|nr:helix-hairpin-helix domain-containing protein [Chitinophagaceae bacterium]